MTRRVMKDSAYWVPGRFTKLEAAVSTYCDVSPEAMAGPSRQHEILMARWLLFYHAFTGLRYKAAAIGRYCDRDHTTVLNAVKRIKADPDLLELAAAFRTKYPELFAG